ncbi:MAG: hypothetical protein NTY03_04400, partial [Candidatus Bathyarchaeota archaeon]|nr:hypothetical protein [Candidatus Bathyarchaeota archaeon]
MAKKSKQENHFEQPTIWSKDKLALLKKLRRELESKERIQTDAKSSKQVTRKQFKPCSIVQRISGPNEGIEYLTDDTCTKATLGPYDQMLSQLAIYVGIGPAKLAIGMPRVPVGISTWQALSGMIGRVELSGITRKNAGSAKHHLMKQPWIMIACRERWVRDLYLSQRVRLSGESFKVSDFPAYRFGRNGQLKQISIAHPNYLSAPVVFYHFDQINCPKLNLEAGKVDLVLAEMSESNSRSCETWFTRLEQIRSILGDPKTILFFNSFDRRLRSCLIDNDYVIIDIRPQPQTNLDFSSVPTIHSTYSRYTYPEQVTVDIMTDQEISGALLDSARSIAKVAEEIKSIEGRQLIARYWILWRILKDIAIPMDIYERYRIHVQGRGSIESAIDRISNLVN